jgi:outer membrane protein TolC
LLIDERRVAVKTADLKWQAAKAKQENSINELLYEASLLYWEWFRSFHTLETWKATLENAKQRYKATQGIVRTGERPMIDTVDAGVQLQNLTLGKLQAEAEWQKQRIQLAAFLWDDEQATYGLPDYTLPPLLKVNALPDPSPLIPAEGDRFSHPYLEQLAFVSKEIDLQKKWATDRFKPTVQLQYMPLAEAVGSPLLSQFSLNNYKWGMEVKVPLLFRKERADLQLAKVRDLENTLEIADKQAQLRAKLNANYAMWNNYRDQVSVSFTTVQQYQQLYEAEARLFAIGESTLFMVNLRELAYLQAKLKLVDVITKYNVTLSDIHYAAGKMALLAEPGN